MKQTVRFNTNLKCQSKIGRLCNEYGRQDYLMFVSNHIITATLKKLKHSDKKKKNTKLLSGTLKIVGKTAAKHLDIKH